MIESEGSNFDGGGPKQIRIDLRKIIDFSDYFF